MEIKRISTNKQRTLLKNNLKERTNLALLTDPNHPNYKENCIVAYNLCKNDWKYFVNNFVWLQDPEAERPEDKEIPFLLWDYQEKAGDEIVNAIQKGYDLPVEKSRKLGLTWLVLVILLWGWHFHEWECLMGSRKFEEVDKKGDIGSLLEKMRFMISRLPQFILPEKLNHFHDKVGMIVHPRHGASLAGEGNNPDFGRSDRRKVAFLDEFTSWEQTDRAAWQGLSATTKSRIPVSTPNRRGTNCWFYKIIKDFKNKNKPYLRLHWALNPVFSEGLSYNELGLPTSPWYENEIERASDRQSVSQELDIDYEASMAGKIFSDFSYEDQVRNDIEYDVNLPLYISWDPGLDSTALIWWQHDINKNEYYIIDEYQNSGEGAGDNIYHYIEIVYSKPYKTAIHYGDPNSGQSRNLAAGQSIAAILKKHGIMFRSRPVHSNQRKERIFAARNILKNVLISSKCTLVIEMLSSWQFVSPKSGNTISETPAHNEYSHMGDSFTYFAWNVNKKGERIKKQLKTYKTSYSGVMY